ncbi:type II secretion system protein [Opitutaceae bacterium TAV4]|nr:type II secretion system protein [Opitutaceae bacterium TAV4]RRK00237.1 type II secretion system protein [Opitutaceae bacterium TAV3]
MCSPKKHPHPSAAFTLIELLTVIAIVGILAAIIIPTVGKVRNSARDAGCKSNLRQYAFASMMYAEDNKGKLPEHQGASSPKWVDCVRPYLAAGTRKGSQLIVDGEVQLRCPAFAIRAGEFKTTLDNDTARGRGYQYNLNLRLKPIPNVANPSRTPMFWDGGGAAKNIAGYPGRAGSASSNYLERKYRHSDRMNLVMVSGSISSVRGVYNGSESSDKDDGEIPFEQGGSDWGKNGEGRPFSWGN